MAQPISHPAPKPKIGERNVKITEPSLLQKHLDRAPDLCVKVEEYAEAYNVSLEALIATENQPDLS